MRGRVLRRRSRPRHLFVQTRPRMASLYNPSRRAIYFALQTPAETFVMTNTLDTLPSVAATCGGMMGTVATIMVQADTGFSTKYQSPQL